MDSMLIAVVGAYCFTAKKLPSLILIGLCIFIIFEFYVPLYYTMVKIIIQVGFNPLEDWTPIEIIDELRDKWDFSELFKK
jgi:hypothetical protein